MRRLGPASIALLTVLAAEMRAEVIDRVVAAAGRQVVTLSAVRRSLRMQAVFDLREYVDTPSERRGAADRLIDQAMVSREISLSRYAGATMAEADALLAAFMKERGLTSGQLTLWTSGSCRGCRSVMGRFRPTTTMSLCPASRRQRRGLRR
ncbi:MAG: hypothetical protein HZB13_05270 [Acidobacteria bacterium]|nr:hypothetical protein [Acidobacteriota bacterium]